MERNKKGFPHLKMASFDWTTLFSDFFKLGKFRLFLSSNGLSCPAPLRIFLSSATVVGKSDMKNALCRCSFFKLLRDSGESSLRGAKYFHFPEQFPHSVGFNIE